MVDAILYGIAVEILKKIGSTVLDEAASSGGFKSDLNKLERSISTIKDYLLDAEEKQADSHAVRAWLLKLTDVIYVADNLFDELATVVSRKQLSVGNKFTKEVRTFFSHYNHFAYARSISRRIKAIREELDGLIKEGNDFHLVPRSYVEGRVITRRRDQSHSFAEAEDVIGRDADKNAILELLLSSSANDDDEHEQKVIPVVSIVGMGGLGKTALAQLVYNDPLVEEFFPLRLWVCVSDVFDIKEITEKIIVLATGSKVHKLNMEQLQGMLRKRIGNKKYLLVLDDVWNEDREKWLKMKGLLNIGRKGSKILVTTRSSMVARIMSTFPPYELRGLSDEKSWDLFEKMAFEPQQAQKIPSLVDIGKEIVQKCANVPLAIRTLGSSLYAQDKSKWLSLKTRNLANISFNNHNIMNILEFSYHHLGAPLKNCFAYCALFPKDYNFNKEMLVNLWMAEGFIVPAANENQMIDELAEEYFLTLLQRGFFQDVKMDEWDCIESCKMHDLMHDLAQQVAGIKCKVVNPDENLCQGNNIRHLSITYRLDFQKIIPPSILNLKCPRTFLLPQQISDGSIFNKKTCQKIISFSWLRVLDFHGLGLIKVPASIGKLIHLRYLDLSLNPIKILPDSITELHNIQTPNLYHCRNLLALPAKITKLLNLKSFDVSDCNLSKMPNGIGELNLLRNLPLFIATFEKSSESRSKPTYSAKLCDLKKLNNLRGKLCIVIICQSMIEATQEILTCKHGLTELEIRFDKTCNSINGHLEDVLEGLKPHPNLKRLKISGYSDLKLPSWMMQDSLLNTLPNLVKIHLCNWEYCKQTLILVNCLF